MINVVVCAKPVPGPDEPAGIDRAAKRVNRSGVLVLDDADNYGVEVGLRLVEQAGGGEVTIVSMSPDVGGEPFRTALAMGATRAVVIADEALQGSDALSTAKVLAAAVSRLAPDLVVAATESTDGYTGTVPVQLAELMGVPSVSFARHIELRDGLLVVERQTEDGYDEVSCPLPAVVTVTAGAVEVRYPSIRGVMGARSKPIDYLSLRDLGIDSDRVGEAAARQEVIAVMAGGQREGGRLVIDEGAGELEILAVLEAAKVL